jgi:hypothetical protein
MERHDRGIIAIVSMQRCDSEPFPIEPELSLSASRLMRAITSPIVRAGTSDFNLSGLSSALSGHSQLRP